MNRHISQLRALLVVVLLASSGCYPRQPFYFFEDGDLSHYVDVGTQIEYPDVDIEHLREVDQSLPPLTLENAEFDEFWELSLEEAIQTTLTNSSVIRSLGGRVGNVEGGIDTLLRSGSQTPTVYDTALEETNPGFSLAARNATSAGRGVESALADFDTQLSSSLTYNKNDTPVNTGLPTIFQPVIQQDQAIFQSQLQKTNATGGTSAVRFNTTYDNNNNPTRAIPRDWNANVEFQVTQPLLQGFGAKFNRIAGPGAIVGSARGVVLARINTDISLATFEARVRDLVGEVEDAYWEVFFAYRDLKSQKLGLESARVTWQRVNSLKKQGAKGGEADKEAQAREQFYLFQGQVQEALNSLFRSEARLRYLMGVRQHDGSLIRPSDEPSTAKVAFDWYEIYTEALVRSPELRERKWNIKAAELRLVAAKNYLLPRLDAIGMYRFRGLGQTFTNSQRSGAVGIAGRSALENLTGGDFQEWQLGMQLSMPIGFRRELANVQHQRLTLLREKKIFQEQELEIQQQIAEALRNLTRHYILTNTNFNRLEASEREVEAVQRSYDLGSSTLDLLLDVQRRRSIAESDYYRSLINHVRALTEIHRVKGSLLEYNGVQLAEGPWPAKAGFDAHRLARARDAAHFLDYGITLPNVVSRGPVDQQVGESELLFDGPSDEQDYPREANPEEIEVPQPASSASYRPSATEGGTEGVRQQKSYQGRFASTSKRNSRSTRARSKFSDATPRGRILASSKTANRRIDRKTIGFDWGTLGLSDDSEGDRSSEDQQQNAINLVVHEDEAIVSDEYESVAP